MSPSNPSVCMLTRRRRRAEPRCECDRVIRPDLLPAGWWAGVAPSRMKYSPSECEISLTANHDKRLTHANDQLPLALKTNHFRNIRVNDGLGSY